jgi:WD40 repeat protein
MNYEKEEKIINENGRVFALLEFENDKLLAGTSENVIDLWDVNSVDNNCLYSFEGHELWINCLVKINSKIFASASNDSKIKIWDYFTRTCLFDLQGHADCILSLILLRNNYLCSGSADLTIKIWDWEKQNCVSTLRGHQKWVKSVYELDNGILVSGSDDKTIKLWKDDNLLLTLNGHRHSVRTFCQLNENYFCSGSFDSTIKIWKIYTWECIQTLTGHTSNVICVIKLKEGSKNNKYDLIASCSNDKTIKIWEGKL